MKRFLTFLLCLVMALGMVPLQGAAAEREYSLLDGQYVRILGRGIEKNGGRTFNWPNAGFEFTFAGSTASVKVANSYLDTDAYNGSYFTIVIYDGDTVVRSYRKKLVGGWNNIYTAIKRDPEEKTIRVVRSSDAYGGTVIMNCIKTDATPTATVPKERRIEFIGDFNTAGYGLSHSSNKEYCAQNTDNWNSYTRIVAEYFNAEYTVIAAVDKGVCVGANGQGDYPMPMQFELEEPLTRALVNMSKEEKHDFSAYQPDVVVIWLGENDQRDGAGPEAFTKAYGAFLDNVRAKYPEAKILSLGRTGVGLTTENRMVTNDASRGKENDFYFTILQHYNYTKNGLPTASEHSRIAEQVITKINSIPDFWGDEDKEPVTPPSTEPVLALYNNAKVLVDGTEIAFEAYNIDGNNYFKLRDLAMALRGSGKQFGVDWSGWSGNITLYSGTFYRPVGGELEPGDGQPKLAHVYTGGLSKDNRIVKAQAYNINDNNYFKLRDICKLFNIGVGWDGATSTITVDTEKSYVD